MNDNAGSCGDTGNHAIGITDTDHHAAKRGGLSNQFFSNSLPHIPLLSVGLSVGFQARVRFAVNDLDPIQGKSQFIGKGCYGFIVSDENGVSNTQIMYFYSGLQNPGVSSFRIDYPGWVNLCLFNKILNNIHTKTSSFNLGLEDNMSRQANQAMFVNIIN